MTTTASVYYNKIDVNYPQAGRDNDSQTFRNNFNNIKLAIKTTDDKVKDIDLSAVRTTNTATNFGFNTLRRANLQDCSVNIFDDTANVRSQSVVVDYSNGSYQKFLISNGTTVFSVVNWPEKTNSDLYGSIILSITPETAGNTTIDFGPYVPVGETTTPFQFDSALTVFFELWKESSDSTVYVNQIGFKTGIVATGTTLIATDSIRIGSNTYRTGTNFSTVVSVDTGGTGTNAVKVGNLAVLRNITETTIIDTTGYYSTTTSDYFAVQDSRNIFRNAKVSFQGTSTSYIVDRIESISTDTNSATVFITQLFDTTDAPIGSTVVFSNPIFEDLPTIVTFNDTTVTSITGVPGDFKGTIYADSSTLYVAYEDYTTTPNNWVKFYNSDYIDNIDLVSTPKQLATGTTAVTVPVSTDSTLIATTEFVHNIVPMGSIIMWYGDITAIPTGWALCDGNNGTPDLRNRFIIGATTSTGTTPFTNITGSNSTIGGSKDATLVSHNHVATVNDPGHFHDYLTAPATPFSGDDGAADGPSVYSVNYKITAQTSTATTDITVGISTEGSASTNANLPPYHALLFIMKVV